MAKARKNKTEDMTLEEAWQVLDDEINCNKTSCSDCYSNNNWNVHCSVLREYALRMNKDAFSGMESAMKESAMTDKKSSTEPFYQQTTDFMKKSGYTHCYMCGSELK